MVYTLLHTVYLIFVIFIPIEVSRKYGSVAIENRWLRGLLFKVRKREKIPNLYRESFKYWIIGCVPFSTNCSTIF